MFNKDDIEKYRSIQAPSECRERVLKDCLPLINGSGNRKSKKATFIEASQRFMTAHKHILSAAACFMLFVGIMLGAYASYPESTVVYNSSAESVQTVSGVLPRAKSSITVPLTISVEKTTEVSVSSGVLWLVDEHNEASEMLGVSAEFTENVNVIWVVDLSDESQTITLKNAIKKAEYRLSFNDGAEAVIVKK